MVPPKTLVAEVRVLLDRLVACRRQTNDEQEAVHNEVASSASTLPRAGLLEALDIAVGSSKKRRQEAVYLLAEWSDVPEAISRIGKSLHDPDPNWRAWLIQTVPIRGLRQFAPFLNDIMERDPDPFCRGLAIDAAGSLRQKENLPTLLHLTQLNDKELTWRLVIALQRYATEECRPYLQRWFEDGTEKSARMFAAWGLAKLRDRKAIAYLTEMLHDPDVCTEKSFEPGESIRAAQAICDIYGWPFEWDKAYVAKTIARVHEHSKTQGRD